VLSHGSQVTVSCAPRAATVSAMPRCSGRSRDHASKVSKTSGRVPVAAMNRSRSSVVAAEIPITGVRTARAGAPTDRAGADVAAAADGGTPDEGTAPRATGADAASAAGPSGEATIST
jgi:hypothetical protein